MGGYASVGSQNTNLFKAQISQGIIPDKSSLNYQGCFNEYYYDVGKPEEKKLLTLKNYQAIVTNPLSNQKEVWIASFLKSCKDGKPRDNIPIDAMILLDISGSMQSTLESEKSQSKIDLAKAAIKQLFTDSLRNNDGFGLASFNNTATIMQQIEEKPEVNSEQLFQKITELQANGGTIIGEGIKTCLKEFQRYNALNKQVTSEKREKRIILITDMEDQGTELGQLVKESVSQGIHVSILGVGLDFNTKLTEQIILNEGCNYFSITKDDQLKEIIVDHFHYNFFPCAYHVLVRIESDDYTVVQTFGTSFENTYLEGSGDVIKQVEQEKFGKVEEKEADQKIVKQNAKEQCITEVNTASASAYKDNLMKGGLMLIKLKPNKELNGKLRIILSYSDLNKSEKTTENFDIVIDKSQDQDYFEGEAIKKGILLYRYVDAVQKTIKMKSNLVSEYDKIYYNLDTMENLLKDNLKQMQDITPVYEQIKQLKENVEKAKKGVSVKQESQ